MTNKNIPKKHYHKRGLTERQEPSLYDIFVVDILNDLLYSNNLSPEYVFSKLQNVIEHIDTFPNAFDSLCNNKEVKNRLTIIFDKLLQSNDYNNISLLLESPLVDLIYFFSKEINLKEHASEYLIAYVANNTDINKDNINDFCEHIKKVITQCNLPDETPVFNHFKTLIENINVEIMYPVKIAKQLKKFFNLILQDKLNPNKDKDNAIKVLEEERKFKIKIDRIYKDCDILLEMMSKFNSKDSTKQNNVLLKALVDSFEDKTVFDFLFEDNTFKEKIILLLSSLLRSNDIIGVSMFLKSPLKKFINFDDHLFQEKVLKHLKSIIIKERLDMENIEVFLTYIWKIIKQFKITSADFASLKSPLYQRIKKEFNGVIKKKLQQFYNENFN